MKEKLAIIKRFGLQVEHLEASVYRVINTEKEINIDELQWELGECILITSIIIRYEKLNGDVSTQIANVYYICLDTDNRVLSYIYEDKAKNEFGRTLYKYYKHNENEENFIPTIYAKGEI